MVETAGPIPARPIIFIYKVKEVSIMVTPKSYRSPKTEVRERSKIQGKGVFAQEPIKKGEIVAIKGGHILTSKEYESLDEVAKHYCHQIEDNFFLGPRSEEEIEGNAIFINHSCEPNVGFDGQITYVALRDIKLGEELCHDYAMCFTCRKIEFECNCGSNCRGHVTDADWKLKNLQEKYGNHFASFILKKINSQKKIFIP